MIRSRVSGLKTEKQLEAAEHRLDVIESRLTDHERRISRLEEKA